MAYNIGVNVVEVDGRATPTIAAAPTGIAGFLVASQRGVPNIPTQVTGMSDFTNNFGGYSTTAFGAHALRGFFDNGGSVAQVVRVAGNATTPGVAAAVRLVDLNATNTLSVQAGNHGRTDPGLWGNALAVTIARHARATSLIPAQVIGSSAEPFALTDGSNLTITVNGGTTPVTIAIRAADYANIGAASASEVVASINRQSSVVKAAATSGHIILSSSIPGTASRLSIAGTAANALGFTGATANTDGALPANATVASVQSVGGLLAGSAVRFDVRGHTIAPNAMAATLPANSGINVTPDGGSAVTVSFRASDFAGGLPAITPGEVVAAINRQAVGFTAGLTYDAKLVLYSDSWGAGSTIAVAAPPGGMNDATANLGLTANVPVAGLSNNQALTAVDEQSRLATWAGAQPAVPANETRLQSVEFDLVVQRSGSELERFEALSMQSSLAYYAPAIVNSPDTGSRFIVLTSLASGSPPGQNIPASGTFNLGTTTSGDDGGTPGDADWIGDPAQRTGLHAFDVVSIQLLACPETTSPAVVEAALGYCGQRGDCMFVGACPMGLDLDGLKTYASPFRMQKAYGAMYGPNIQIVNPVDTTGNHPTLWIPPTGHILGMYVRIAGARGVWKAPAGDDAGLVNALAVEFDMTDTEHTDLVKNGGVNGVRAIAGSGIVVDSSRTLSTSPLWWFIATRLLFNFIKSSLRDGLTWVSQEPHTDELRRAVKFNVVTPFLLGLWSQGAFGSGTPDQVFTVKCDADNNPPAQVVLGMFKLEVYFYPVKPAETIVIVVGQQASGASAQES